jgi:hypothetical protein
MAHLVFTNAYVLLNSVDLSAHVKSVSIDYKAEIQDETVMGDTARGRLPGLKDWSVQVEFHQDFAAASVDATLFPLVGASAFAIEIKPVNTTASATNPRFTGSALLESYSPIGGTVGDVLMAPITLLGDGTLTRQTS